MQVKTTHHSHAPLGLRRVKKTVNFDSPDAYYLYCGDEVGTLGPVMTYFPCAKMLTAARGAGEVAVTEFGVPEGALPYWQKRLADQNVKGLQDGAFLGWPRPALNGPDGDSLAPVETPLRARKLRTSANVPQSAAVRVFRGARFCLRDDAATSELLRYTGYQLRYTGYQKGDTRGNVTRCVIEGGNAANTIDLQ